MAQRIEWPLLQGALVALTAAIALAAGLVAAARWFHDSQARVQATAQAAFRATSDRYLDVDREATIIEQRYPHFLELLAQGVLGREDRLSWVEAIKAAAAELDAHRLEYRIEARRAWDGPISVQSAPFEVLASRMRLTAVLWHEGDLLTLLDGIAARAHGIFMTRHCRLEPVGGERDPDPATVRQRGTVQVQCELDWITVDWPGEREIRA
jgi:hypothetical protein